MNRSFIRSHPKAVTILLGAAAVATVVSLVFYPSQAFEASLNGLNLWWNAVFPALLPYYILCDIAGAYGLTRIFGGRLGPFLIGSPYGAAIAAKQRRDGLISRAAAERLTVTTHYANPIFMITVIAAAFLKKPELGLFIIIVHYGSAFLCKSVIRYFGRRKQLHAELEIPPANQAPPTDRYRTFGQVLGESVADSLQKLMELGGTIIMFAVALKLASELGISNVIIKLIQPVLIPFRIPNEAFEPMLAGFFEMHIGAYALTQSPLAMGYMLAFISAALAWGGIAVHLQVRAALHNTDIRYTPFLLGRLSQAAAAAGIALLLWQPYQRFIPSTKPSFMPSDVHTNEAASFGFWPNPLREEEIIMWVTALLILTLSIRPLVKRGPYT